MKLRDWLTCFRLGVSVGSAIKNRSVFDAGFRYGWDAAIKKMNKAK
jgi:hypothetical protein